MRDKIDFGKYYRFTFFLLYFLTWFFAATVWLAGLVYVIVCIKMQLSFFLIMLYITVFLISGWVEVAIGYVINSILLRFVFREDVNKCEAIETDETENAEVDVKDTSKK